MGSFKMEAIKKYAVLGLLAALFVGEVAAMRMSPQQAKLFAARQAASKRGMQMPSKAQPTKTDAVKAQELKELKEAFMSDNDYITQKTESLKSGEYFVHAKGTTDGIVVKRDVLEKSPVLKGMLEDAIWSQDNAAIPLPFSADAIKTVFNVLDVTKDDNVTELSSKQLKDIKTCLDYLDIYTIFYDNLANQKAKKLSSGEYFVYAQGTADGIVVKRDVLEKSPVLKDMLEGTTWSKDNAAIPLQFSADAIKTVVNLLNFSKNGKESLKILQVFIKEHSPEKLVDALNNVYALSDYFDIPQILEKGDYFVYAKETGDGIVVKRNLLEKSLVFRSMFEDMGGTWQLGNATISLPFSVRTIQEFVLSILPFSPNTIKDTLKKISLDKLVDQFNLVDYLDIPEIASLCSDEVVARINDIGDKIIKKEATPDYTVLGNIKDPEAVKTIINKVISTPHNFCQRFTDLENARYGRSDDGNQSDRWNYNPEQSVNEMFQNLTSINGILDRVKNELAHWDKISANYRKKEEEDKKKWFWQRW